MLPRFGVCTTIMEWSYTRFREAGSWRLLGCIKLVYVLPISSAGSQHSIRRAHRWTLHSPVYPLSHKIVPARPRVSTSDGGTFETSLLACIVRGQLNRAAMLSYAHGTGRRKWQRFDLKPLFGGYLVGHVTQSCHLSPRKFLLLFARVRCETWETEIAE